MRILVWDKSKKQIEEIVWPAPVADCDLFASPGSGTESSNMMLSISLSIFFAE